MENNEITIFNNAEFGSVRTLVINDEPWFVGKDVCEVFGDKNHIRSVGRIDDDDKKVVTITDSRGVKQNATFINESGLYSLLFNMQPQKANNKGVSDAYPLEIQERIDRLRKFKHWVTAEVLPSIRKTGSYSVPKTREQRLAAALLDAQNVMDEMQRQIEEDRPKVEYMDDVVSREGTSKIGDFAKSIGVAEKWLRKRLEEDGFIFHVGSDIRAYAEVVKSGLLTEKPHFIENSKTSFTTYTVYITNAGLSYFKNLYEVEYKLKKIEDKIKHIEGLKRKTKDKLEELAVLCEQRDLLKSPALLN